MDLQEYARKRNFQTTPEPERGLTILKKRSWFVVQKHQATHLHYDLRLEVEGALKSWAIPKEPGLNPNRKLLAMMVEDHPMEYKNFEGIIPPGNYGAGTVMVWDRGFYFPLENINKKRNEAHILKGLDLGKISIILEGKKLKGEFALVKIKKSSKNNSWLFIKKNDEYANKEIEEKDLSVQTGRNMSEITLGRKKIKIENIIPKEELERFYKSDIPEKIMPMTAHPVRNPFDSKDWIFEIKYDGYRIIARINKDIQLLSRKGLEMNDVFPAIKESLKQFPARTVLDGEIVVQDREGKSDFGLLQRYIKENEGYPVYYIFDILYLERYDLKSLPLNKRKEILHKIFPQAPNIKYALYVEKNGLDLFNLIKKRGIEGIIGKKIDSAYRPGIRSADWLKIKLEFRQEAVIGGFTQPRGGRKDLGALVLGVYEKNTLVYIGHTGGGFDEKGLSEMKKNLEPYIIKKTPFEKEPKTNAPVSWVEPRFVCEIKFAGWTRDGYMRQPIFLGLRDDKKPKEVRREVPRELNLEKKSDFSNQEKIFWPKENYTKGDLLDYYEKISSVILPYLKDRPESLHRFPNGITGNSFYQKNARDFPGWVKTIPIYSETEEREINYVLCQNKETLLYLANLGCIEINPWNSRIQYLDYPDYLVLDIDPGGASFQDVVRVALESHKILEEIEVKNFCKTSGATGLHIYVPLGAKYAYMQAREFAKLVNLLVNYRLPDITTLIRKPGARENKVYLDYLQNRKGQTLVSPYSLRPLPGAPVSTPLLWNEVRSGLDPKDFNIKNIFSRIEKKGDIWREAMKSKNDLEKTVKLLGEILKNYRKGGEDMPRYGRKSKETVKHKMHKFKKGELKSGRSGKTVKSRKQAVAIGLSEARKKGAKVPPPK